jgi:lysophospholipase L1-like esterase
MEKRSVTPARTPAGAVILRSVLAVAALAAGLSGGWSSPWETSDIGAVWSDNFNRASLGTNWVILGSANASIVSNELLFVQGDQDSARQVYYQPWLISSDQWTLRWSQRFGTLDEGSVGVGVGIKNFQAAGGNDRGYNALLYGAGTNIGKMALERWDGTNQDLVTLGPALKLAAGDVVDCWLTRSGWTISTTASNRANGQVSAASLVFSDFVEPRLEAPTISRMCFYPLQGTVYMSNLSFVINHRKPARFIVIGASIADGYDAMTYAQGFVRVVQSNFAEAVCNDSSSCNTTGDSVRLLPEILAHQPGTAILTIGANDLAFGYPASQWQENYANLVAQLQANGVNVKHCLPTPATTTDLRPLKRWLSANYPASDVIDNWTPLVANRYQLNPAYDNYDHDGVHPNDAGHLLIGQIIISNLSFAIRAQPQNLAVATGSNASFTVTATGDTALRYQWQLNGLNLANGGCISGATTNALIIFDAQASDAGGYTVVVTNAAGAITSAVATLTVVVPPQVTTVTWLPDQTPLLCFNAVSNLTYRIDASTDLLTWAALTNFTDPNGTVQFNDPDATNFWQRFYRAVWVP